ncbi:uncharacterized protein LOC142523462 [Primulina tabacum]|uniref:uncharacterized protein LOC142523462 n=1 Tax=Primulina tabacum TaxID=48773 RepID=UPI003F5A9BE0
MLMIKGSISSHAENNIEINGESPQVQSKVHATDAQNLSNDDARLVTNQEKEDCLRKSDEEDDDKNDIEDERLNKKPRMSWTDELRLQFEKAIKILGEEKARPKEILKLMGVSNVTLRHVSSHLQKYREKKKRTGINCATAQLHQFKLTNMDSRMKRQYQNGKPWDLHDLNSKKSPVAETMTQPTSQYVHQQHNIKSSSVHYQIDMVEKLLDKAKGKQTNNYDDIAGYMKGGCNKELRVGRSSMHG